MPHILLTGAGFSRNWGGWLADEAFEYLLSTHQIDGGGIRDLLWKYKRSRGGFEAALGYLQGQLIQHPHSESAAQNVERLKGAILQMFGDMNKNFVKRRFEFQDDQQYSMGRFLAKFDAIFTLNQDLLLEQRYIRGNYLQDSDSRWKQCETPGMERIITNESMEPIEWRWSPFSDAKKFPHAHDVQPYFKLHGSSNWIDTIKGQHLLVMGGNKPDTIKQHAILQWNHDRFNDHLSKPDTRLMIIGYSFGDEHINVAIRDAAEKGTLVPHPIS